MKPNRDAAALAASLSTAASAPLRLPERPTPPPVIEETKAEPPAPAARPREVPREAERKVKMPVDTVAISLRPSKETLMRYTRAAAERTMKEGRVISAQQLMLEVLETGPKVKK